MDDDEGLGILPEERKKDTEADAPDAKADEQPVEEKADADEQAVDEKADAPDEKATDADEGKGTDAADEKPDEKSGEASDDAPEAPDITALSEDHHILCLKTQVGQERRVAEMLGNKARRFGLPLLSLLAPQELRGYVFIETTDPLAVEKGIRGVSYARALVTRDEEQVDEETGEFLRDRRGKVVTRKFPVDVPFNEISHFLTPVSAVAKIADGDIVELVSGPFRGEKAKVTRVDDAREEITVELIESMVPIPITVKGEHVRVLEKASE